MRSEFENKITETKKRDQERRTELAMLGLLIEKYPRDTEEKMQKLSQSSRNEQTAIKKPLA